MDDERGLYVDRAYVLIDDETFVIPTDWWIATDGGQNESTMLQVLALVAKWRRDRMTETIIVTVPQAQGAAVRAERSWRGWTVA